MNFKYVKLTKGKFFVALGKITGYNFDYIFLQQK